MSIPVLFTCAGQRADVVSAFRAAGALTIATDLNPLAPALYHADRRISAPAVDDPRYVPFLAELVAEHGVELVVPLTDLDQRLLAERRSELGALVLLPGVDAVDVANDKFRAHQFFEERGIGSPPTWLPSDLPAELPFPVLVKPRRGFGSRGIHRCEDDEQLAFFLRYTTHDSMVQRICAGEEFSIDAFGDLDGRCLNAIPRTMIESKGGESIKGMSIRDEALIDVGRRVCEALRVAGPVTVQCFRTDDGRYEVTDVNPRFGGAFPLPTAAGSGYPELALELARGRRPEPRLGEFREGVLMTRFFWQVCLADDGSAGLAPIDASLPATEAV